MNKPFEPGKNLAIKDIQYTVDRSKFNLDKYCSNENISKTEYYDCDNNTVPLTYDESYTMRPFLGTINIYLHYKEVFKKIPLMTKFGKYNIFKQNNYILYPHVKKYLTKYFEDLDEIYYDNFISYDAIKEQFNNKNYKDNMVLISKKHKVLFYVDTYALLSLHLDTDYFKKFSDDTLKIYKKIVKKVISKDKQYSINFLLQGPDGLYLHNTIINYYNQKFDIQELYDFNVVELIEKINSDHSGVVILKGDVGSGKSSLCKYLSMQSKKKFIYIPNRISHVLDDPGFLKLLIENNDSVIILEDAEEIILTKGGERNSGLATLLNIADGILGDLLKLKIIITFNHMECRGVIDKALLRKGRLLGEYQIDNLSLEKTKVLMKKLHNIDVNEPMTLANIFNYNTKIEKVEIKTLNPIGFKI